MIKADALKPIQKTGLPIDKDVPLPPDEPRREPKYPFAKMEVGDSFYAYGVTRGSLTSAAKYAGAKLGFTFICRADGEDGARCWRTE